MVKPRVVVIDNYDSFTFNLVQALSVLGADVHVFRNDAVDADGVRGLRPTHLVISPGPGRPETAGNTLSILEAMLSRVPVLGVCLGHQALATILGGSVARAPRPVHGKPSRIRHDGRGLYRGMPDPIEVGRYNSLLVDEASLPRDLAVASRSDDGEIMGLRHRSLPAEGVQFHPESVLTPGGSRLLANFLEGVPEGRSPAVSHLPGDTRRPRSRRGGRDR